MQDYSVLLANGILLGIALAMDAFAVSISNGIAESGMSRKKKTLIPFVYALFQFAMPLIGWVCVSFFAREFEAFAKIVPWVAFAVLAFLGIRMLISGIRKSDHPEQTSFLTLKVLLLQAVMTSIDALSVGFATSNYDIAAALLVSALIGVITFAICRIGLMLGHKVGEKLGHRSGIIGGLILIAIGIEMLF